MNSDYLTGMANTWKRGNWASGHVCDTVSSGDQLRLEASAWQWVVPPPRLEASPWCVWCHPRCVWCHPRGWRPEWKWERSQFLGTASCLPHESSPCHTFPLLWCPELKEPGYTGWKPQTLSHTSFLPYVMCQTCSKAQWVHAVTHLPSALAVLSRWRRWC